MVSFIRKTFGSVLTSTEVNDYQVAIENTDATVTSHVANTSNPHSVTKSQVGLSNVPNTDATARANHTGTQSADTVIDGTTNKAYTATEKTKLSGIATGATANDTDANLKNRANHTGTQSADTITDGTTNKAYTATEKTKLGGIATGADVTSATNVGTSINGSAAKTTPVDADTVPLLDSAASNVLKKVTWANIKATIKTYTDTLYATITHSHAQSDVTNLVTDLAAKVPTSRTINSQALSSNVTLTQDNIGDGTTYKQYSQTEKTKLAGIATGATANSSDATLLNRANHTGTQTSSTISDIAEVIRDTIGTALVGGTNIGVVVDDTGDTITINGAITSEVIRDIIGGIMGGDSSITVTYNDAADTITVALTGVNADLVSDGTTNKAYTATEKTKLAGIASGADVTSATNVGAAIHAQTNTAIASGDFIPFIDTTDSNQMRKASWTSILLDFVNTFAPISHTTNTSNPHSVTKSQVGLGSVPDVDGTKGQLSFTFDGGGAVIPANTTTGQKSILRVPYNCTITGAYLYSQETGSIVVDIWRDTNANYPPTDADSITSSTPPTISSSNKNGSGDTTLSSWTTTLNAGDVLYANVDSCTTITHASLFLAVTQTS